MKPLTLDDVARWAQKRFVKRTEFGFLRESGGSRLLYPLCLKRGASLTIASGAITVSFPWHRVDTEGGAATDDLDTINGGYDGQLVVLSPQNAAHDIVVKHNTGNIWLAGAADITLGLLPHKILLMYDAGNSKWNDLR